MKVLSYLQILEECPEEDGLDFTINSSLGYLQESELVHHWAAGWG